MVRRCVYMRLGSSESSNMPSEQIEKMETKPESTPPKAGEQLKDKADDPLQDIRSMTEGEKLNFLIVTLLNMKKDYDRLEARIVEEVREQVEKCVNERTKHILHKTDEKIGKIQEKVNQCVCQQLKDPFR